MLSEQDGYFSFLGLKPGSYTASVDKEQLQKINLKSLINSLPFNIVRNKDGDVVDGLEFVVQSLSDTLQQKLDIHKKQEGVIENHSKSAEQEMERLVKAKANITQTITIDRQKPESQHNRPAEIQNDTLPARLHTQKTTVPQNTQYKQQKKVKQDVSIKSKAVVLDNKKTFIINHKSPNQKKSQERLANKSRKVTLSSKRTSFKAATKHKPTSVRQNHAQQIIQKSKSPATTKKPQPEQNRPAVVKPSRLHDINKEQDDAVGAAKQIIQKIQGLLRDFLRFIQ